MPASDPKHTMFNYFVHSRNSEIQFIQMQDGLGIVLFQFFEIAFCICPSVAKPLKEDSVTTAHWIAQIQFIIVLFKLDAL